MKKLIFSFSVFALSVAASASVKIEEEAYVLGQSPEVIKELITAGSVEIDHVTKDGFEVFGGKGLLDYLESRHVPHMDLLAVNKSFMAGYPSHAQIAQKLKNAEAKNPKIMKLFSIGKSVKGQDLWVMKISDNVESDEVEPEFKYISSMHGDEITGREMTVSLIEEMVEKYGRDPEITSLINNTEIYILPSMNPDGSSAMRRANAKGVDLNRNFPDISRDTTSSSSSRELENQHVMAWQASRQFSLSANFHGGTIVANYPWDSIYDLHPFDALVKELSLAYADRNPEMRNSSDFDHGITNGAAWYIVRGGMQDWSYFWFNDLQITLEVSHRKWPDYSDIPGFYRSNRDSMVHYMGLVHQGGGIQIPRGNVEGKVQVKQVAPVAKDWGTYGFRGSEFYKVLPTGQYEFVVTENGGRVQTAQVSVEKSKIAANGNFQVLE
jgi:Zinc carboxypeptidase